MTDKAKASEHDLREGSKPRCPKCGSTKLDDPLWRGFVACKSCGKATNVLQVSDLSQFFAAILEENRRLRKRAVPPKELPRYTDPPDICPTCDTRSFISDGPRHYVCYNCHNTKLLDEAETENQRLAKELERFKALEAHLPKGYAIGDDATAELAVKLAKIRELVNRGRVRYSRDRGEPDPTPPFAYEAAFSLSDWKELVATLAE